MTGSLIFTVKAIELLREAAIHTPTFIGCHQVFFSNNFLTTGEWYYRGQNTLVVTF
jgi:hypothetical protein